MTPLMHQLKQLHLTLQPYYRTIQLAGTYLAIIMIMSISFSAVIYNASAQAIGRQLPPASLYDPLIDYDESRFTGFFQDRIEHGRHEVFNRLFALNLFVLIIGAFVSFVLARRTLGPIEEALEAQSRFASDASHELRTPLAAIQTENEVALRNPNLTLKRSKELLASNLEEVMRLQALSDGLLKLARHDYQDIVLTDVVLSDATSDAIKNYQRAAEAKHIRIHDKSSEISTFADRAGLTQVIGILIDNAIKYSPADTTISITSGARNKRIFLRVSDQGPGIHKDDLPHIFERFYRADSSRTKHSVSGHGLGLALAENLIHHMGGTISATSRKGKGATFTITLPRA